MITTKEYVLSLVLPLVAIASIALGAYYAEPLGKKAAGWYDLKFRAGRELLPPNPAYENYPVEPYDEEDGHGRLAGD